MKEILLVILALAFPYSKMPHTWRAVFTTKWWTS